MVRPEPSKDSAIARSQSKTIGRGRSPLTKRSQAGRWHLSKGHRPRQLLLIVLGLLLLLWLGQKPDPQPLTTDSTPPLVMSGGNPYVRALMRTISASEANSSNPYTILYGGEQIQDLSQHPERCITIVSGPNKGDCTTAAGRYQFIDTTWLEKARQYHPQPSGLWMWASYSFAPQFQDQVVYAWLSDERAWEADIPTLLEAGQLKQVFQLLSGTWTSLGYGIEDNSITPYLAKIYQQMLSEELAS